MLPTKKQQDRNDEVAKRLVSMARKAKRIYVGTQLTIHDTVYIEISKAKILMAIRTQQKSGGLDVGFDEVKAHVDVDDLFIN